MREETNVATRSGLAKQDGGSEVEADTVVLASLQGLDGLKTVGDDVSLVGNRYRCHSSLA